MGTMEFNALLVSNSEFLRPFAITLTKDQEVAQDLYQETLYRALANREKYNVGTNIRAWLYTIMRNIFINNYRRAVKRAAVIEKLPHEYFINNSPADHFGVEASLHTKEILEQVHKLPEIFRLPFLLHFEGFRYYEIAEMLKEPLGTIKSRIHFARRLLKKHIDRY
jgi:RNA polymerase sigma factor (sigma-70 family)